jgi:hypothetical protein
MRKMRTRFVGAVDILNYSYKNSNVTGERISYDGKIIIPELRLNFRKYEVAESYAQFYRDMYGQQYKFRVIGIRKDIAE